MSARNILLGGAVVAVVATGAAYFLLSNTADEAESAIAVTPAVTAPESASTEDAAITGDMGGDPITALPTGEEAGLPLEPAAEPLDAMIDDGATTIEETIEDIDGALDKADETEPEAIVEEATE